MKRKSLYQKLNGSVFIVCFVFNFFYLEKSWASSPKNKLKYQANFDKCPSRTAGSLILNLIKVFEKEHSLGKVKKYILRKNLSEKHFVSDYQIQFNPVRNLLKFNLECPTPLMKVQIYKKNSSESYDAILVDNGRLFDPTYEVLLKAEKKINQSLPYLALPVKKLNSQIQIKMAQIIKNTSQSFRQKLSEIIINDVEELTIILSVEGRPSSVFLGREDWGKKITKLQRIISFMQEKKRIPTIINLTNSDKVVVKFNGKF